MEIRKIYSECAVVELNDHELRELHEWLSTLPPAKWTRAKNEMRYAVTQILEQM